MRSYIKQQYWQSQGKYGELWRHGHQLMSRRPVRCNEQLTYRDSLTGLNGVLSLFFHRRSSAGCALCPLGTISAFKATLPPNIFSLLNVFYAYIFVLNMQLFATLSFEPIFFLICIRLLFSFLNLKQHETLNGFFFIICKSLSHCVQQKKMNLIHFLYDVCI